LRFQKGGGGGQKIFSVFFKNFIIFFLHFCSFSFSPLPAPRFFLLLQKKTRRGGFGQKSFFLSIIERKKTKQN
jgi:hypothetical protein